MNSYMVVSTFKDGVTLEDIRELIPAEQVAAKILEENGTITSIKVAMPRRTVFLEAHAENEEELMNSIHTLPMSKIWNIEVFAFTPPAGVMPPTSN